MSQQIIYQGPKGSRGISAPYVYFTATIVSQKVVGNQQAIEFDLVTNNSSNVTYTTGSPGTIFNIPEDGDYKVSFYAGVNTILAGSGQARFVLNNNFSEVFTMANETETISATEAYTVVKADLQIPLVQGTVTLHNALNVPVTITSPSTVFVGNETACYLTLKSLYNPNTQ